MKKLLIILLALLFFIPITADAQLSTKVTKYIDDMFDSSGNIVMTDKAITADTFIVTTSGTTVSLDGSNLFRISTTDGDTFCLQAYHGDSVDYVDAICIENETAVGGKVKVNIGVNAEMGVGVITVTSDSIGMQTSTSSGDHMAFAAYDVDGTTYKSIIRLLAGNTVYGYLGDETNYTRWDESGNLVQGGTAGLAPSNETVTCVTDAGVASASIVTSFIVTDGGTDTNEDTVSLADGATAGQIKIFVYKTETDSGDTANVTPTHASFTKIVFDTPGEGCMMVFDGTNWNIISNNGGTIS